jgi:inhibitor of cysteine peptidase
VRVRLLATVAVLMLSTVVGCHFASRNPPSTKTLQVPMNDVLTQSEIKQNVTLSVGNTLVVELGSNYTTPYRWTPDTTIGDASVIKQLSHQFVQPTSDALGAPGNEEWTFAALKPGSTTVSTSYTSFVGKDAKPACTYTLTVTVQ